MGKKFVWLSLMLGLIGCSWDWPNQGVASDVLRARGFTDAVVSPRTQGLEAMHPCGSDYQESCTQFSAVAPWGWKVAGHVGCNSMGCRVFVEFDGAVTRETAVGER